MFYGEYKSKLDSENRVPLPSKFLEIIKQRKVKEFILVPSPEFCIDVFEKNIDFSQVLDDLQPVLEGEKWYCKIDSRGRIAIPEVLKEYAKIKTNIIILGVSKSIEIWSYEEWAHFYTSNVSLFNTVAKGLLESPEESLEETNKSKKLRREEKERFFETILSKDIDGLRQLVLTMYLKNKEHYMELLKRIKAREVSKKSSEPEGEKVELEKVKNEGGLWYKNLGMKITCDDKPKLFFYVVGREEKEVLVKMEAKKFAVLFRLAIAMTVGEKFKDIIGYVHIHPKEAKIEKCFGECEWGYNEKCLYFEYRGKEAFRAWLAGRDIFNLSRGEKKDLIYLFKKKGIVKLPILPDNIKINEIENIKKYYDRLSPDKIKNLAHKKGAELAKKLINDACNVYENYLKFQSKSANQKL